MLNLKRKSHFKYDLNEILNDSNTEEKYLDAFKATLLMKAEKSSIADTKEYLEQKCEEEIISEEIKEAIGKLLDKYRKRR